MTKEERIQKKSELVGRTSWGWAGGGDGGCVRQYLEIEPAERKQKSSSSCSRAAPASYSLIDILWSGNHWVHPHRHGPKWDWGMEGGMWKRRRITRQQVFFSPNGFLTRGTADLTPVIQACKYSVKITAVWLTECLEPRLEGGRDSKDFFCIVLPELVTLDDYQILMVAKFDTECQAGTQPASSTTDIVLLPLLLLPLLLLPSIFICCASQVENDDVFCYFCCQVFVWCLNKSIFQTQQRMIGIKLSKTERLKWI